MTTLLKESTAFTFRLGPFVDSTDGVTAETGLTITQSDIQISKNGGAFAQTSDASPTTTHDANGWYQLPFTATDSGTKGPLTVSVAMAGTLPVWKDFLVVPANVYDSLVSDSDFLDVQVAGIDANAVTASAIQTDAIGSAELADSAVTEIRDAVTGGAYALNTTATGNIGIDWANVENPTTAVDLSGTDIQLVDTCTTNTDMVAAAPTAASNADAVWDEASAEHTGLGSFGSSIDGLTTSLAAVLADTNELQGDWVDGGRLDLILDARAAEATVDALNDISAAEVNAECLDVVATDTIAEQSQGIPTATPTMRAALSYLYMALRNKGDQTSTFKEFHNDAGTVVWKKAISDDATTYSEAKGESGP